MQDRATGEWLLAGIVSFGESCSTATIPGVYADVAGHAEFIASGGLGGVAADAPAPLSSVWKPGAWDQPTPVPGRGPGMWR